MTPTPAAPPTTAEAVAASVACARALGLPHEHPEVVAEGYSVRVRLHPSPVLTRVVTEGQRLRPRPRAWLEREVAVGRHLADRGAAASAPWDEPGPHRAAGLDVSLWRWVPHRPGRPDAATFGRALGDLHAALDDDDPGDLADLPLLVGALTDIGTALERHDDPVLHRTAAALLPLVPTWPRRVLHGDAHLGNLLLGDDGPCWIDLEDACTGPTEWDLASLTLDDAAVAAYPGPVDAERLRDCRDLRRLQVLAGLLVGWGGSPEERTLRATLATTLDARD